MLFIISFFLELLLLFLLSRVLTRLLSIFFHRVTHSTQSTVYLMAVLFFPGTVIHELSHFLMAHLVFVKTGEIDLLPKLEENTVKLGSVAVERTDPFRRLLIGMAPFLFGTSILLGLLFTAVKQNWFANIWILLLIIYALFEIGNTMFSSHKDMEGAIELLLVVLFLSIIFYLLGIRLPAINVTAVFANSFLVQVFQKGSLFLLAPLGIDIIVISSLKIFRR